MRRTSARLAKATTPPRKRHRTPTPSASDASDVSDASADSEPEALPAAASMDEAGIVGPGVQVPSPAVWQLLAHAVRVDKARTVAALVNAMGGPLRGAGEDSVLSEMSLECYLAMLMPPAEALRVGDTVRVLCPAMRWRTGTITIVGAGIVMASVEGVDAPMRVDRIDWRYKAPPRGVGAAAPAVARRPPARLSLTVPGPDDHGRMHALELQRMSSKPEAAAAIIKRIAYGAGTGNRLARRAVLAIHTRQTEDEQRGDYTLHRNSVGWSTHDARRCVHLLKHFFLKHR